MLRLIGVALLLLAMGSSIALTESLSGKIMLDHSFLSMSLIDARRRNARPRRLRFSQSLARRLHRPSHANVRSTTHRLGKTMKPFA